jgi:phthalate 4,5-dioxygenase oxygenase subunit
MTPQELTILRRARRGTPVGDALRRHWLPVLPEGRLPNPDGEPVSLRVLNEPLVLFTDTTGRHGVIDAYCPHEGGSLARGENAQGGLTCLLHGWKFDVDGYRVDSAAVHVGPIRTANYPVAVARGRVWIYMGPPELAPPRPS